MKFLTSFLCLLSFFLSAQENPWEPKKTENPWTVETEKADTIATVDSTDNAKMQFENVDQESDKDLINVLENDANDRYKAGGSFAVGFVSGLVLNYPGALVATIAAIPSTKQEKKVVEAVATDSTYNSINKDLATKKAKSAVKSKKILHSLLGAGAGTLTQIAILIALFN